MSLVLVWIMIVQISCILKLQNKREGNYDSHDHEINDWHTYIGTYGTWYGIPKLDPRHNKICWGII